jgi:hypothetical protein
VIEIDTQKEYIGTRSSHNIDIGKGYFTSSRDKVFKERFKNYPEQFICVIEGMYETREEAVGVEIFLHNFYDVGRNPHFINKAKQTSTGFDITGNKEIAEKIGKSKKGVKLNISEEMKMKRKVWINKKRPDHSKKMKGEKNPFYGKKHSDETKRKISEANKGKLKGEKNPSKRPEVKQKKIDKWKEIPIITCPHCGIKGRGGSMKRWHFKNCKLNDSFWEEW